MKIIYLIIADKSASHLRQLLSSLQDDSSAFVIHVDARKDQEDFQSSFMDRTDIFFVAERMIIEWGNFTAVQAVTNGLKFIVKNLGDYQRVILLDGSDYPIKPSFYIKNFFIERSESIFIEYFKIPDRRLQDNGILRFPNFSQLQKTISVFCGMPGFSIPLNVAKFILAFIELNTDFVDYYKSAVLPYESFFQTLLLNSGEAFILNNLVNNGLHFLKWDIPLLYAKKLSSADIGELKRSEKLFAGQIDTAKQPGLIKLIDEFVYGKSYISEPNFCLMHSGNEIKSTQCILYHAGKGTRKNLNKLERVKDAAENIGIKLEVVWKHVSPDSGNGKNKISEPSLSNKNCKVSDELKCPESGINDPVATLLKYYLQNDHYDYYWYIDEFVHYNATWEHFFDFFSDCNMLSDFISSNLTDCASDQKNFSRSRVSHPELVIDDQEIVRSFNPIFRISNRALELFQRSLSDGWNGDYNTLLPTLLKYKGLLINDFGGDNRYAKTGYVNKFYRAGIPDLLGRRTGASIRENVPIKEEEIKHHLLYYPVDFEINGSNHLDKKLLPEFNDTEDKPIAISVIMPTYNQCYYIRRAINSLISQSFVNWELIIINDGCTDDTEIFISDFLENEKIQYAKNLTNKGLGYCLNQGLELAKYDYIAYLPSDDFYYDNHLDIIAETFINFSDLVFVYTSAKSEIFDSFGSHCIENEQKDGIFTTLGIQLVQASHKKNNNRWVVRDDLVTANLTDMYWLKLSEIGGIYHIKDTTCNWSIHPFQRHKIIDESFGGSLHKYKNFYGVETPLRIALGQGKFVDEFEQFAHKKKNQRKKGNLKILLVGDLSYNHDRILAFEEQGCQLYGLWASNVGAWSNTGPLPFGNVINIPYDNWRQSISNLQPDIIYAQLNHGAIDLAHEVLSSKLEAPFIWHFKEGPSAASLARKWPKLMELYLRADGRIFINEESKDWYNQFIPFDGTENTYILDGDLARAEYFKNKFAQKLSSQDGEVHTVAVGRMIGLSIEMIQTLASCNIHIHVYPGNGLPFNNKALQIAPDHYHVHSFCSPTDWTYELSRYDAAWLHCIPSQNKGSMAKMSWDDLNMPCRISTYAAAGLPMILLKNEGSIVAVRNYLHSKSVAILFDSCEDLAMQLQNAALLNSLAENMLEIRMSFSFDYNIEPLIRFFKEVIKTKKSSNDEISI
jgi:glycosyltransferase involved in cell wall biosynthesis